MPKRFSGITLLSLAAAGVLLGSEDTEKNSFWERFPHFSVLLISFFCRGRLLSWWNLFPCKYRRNCTYLQRLSSTKTLWYVTKLEMLEMQKQITNISTYGMYPWFLHFLWKLKESNLFSFRSNTPSLVDAMFLAMHPKPRFGELGSGLNRASAIYE